MLLFYTSPVRVTWFQVVMNFDEAKLELQQLLNKVSPSEVGKLLDWMKNSGKVTCRREVPFMEVMGCFLQMSDCK